MTDHHVGLLNRWQGSVEGNSRLSSKLGGSKVGGQRLRQSIADHQTVQDSDGVGQQPGVGESSEPRDTAVHAPLNVTTHTRRPELVERQQRQHLSTDPVTVTNRPSYSDLAILIRGCPPTQALPVVPNAIWGARRPRTLTAVPNAIWGARRPRTLPAVPNAIRGARRPRTLPALPNVADYPPTNSTKNNTGA